MRQRDLHVLQSVFDARGGFGHREHLELAWHYLEIYDLAKAQRVMASAIRRVASDHGALDKYHETVTQSWVHLVALHRAAGSAESFDEFIAENDGLLNRHLLEAHYSRELIGSSRARSRWTEPDLRALPPVA